MIKAINRNLELILLCSFVLIFTQCEKEKENSLHYTVSQLSMDSKSALWIRMKFAANPSGITKVLYDNKAWGEENLFDCISEVKLINSDMQPEINRDSGWIEIRHPKGLKKINFQYSLQQDFEEMGERGESYRPLIQEEYFHVFSHNMFMIPEHLGKDGEDILDITIDWDNFAEGFKIHNSFGTNLKRQRLENIPLNEFHTAIFVGGDFRIYKSEIDGNEIYLASRGDWIPFEDSTVVKILSKTIKAQRDFWKDHSQNYFTVTLRPIPQERGSSFQGTGLTNSFATSISNNKHTDIEQLVYLFNHELQHNWIGHSIENSNEEEQYWFSEGFTEYYTIKNIAKHRIHSLDGSYFIDQLNGIIKNLWASPVKEAPNSDINYENFWSDQDYSKLPYYRGALFAFYLDQLISSHSERKNSLDNLMYYLRKGAEENGEKISHSYFISATNKYLNGDISSFFQEHIEQGKELPLEEIFMNMGLEFQTTAEVFDLGFELSDDQTKVVSVDTSSEAYKAGLRPGDILGSRSIYYGNTERPVELTIGTGSDRKNIKYFAIKVARVPQLVNSSKNIALLSF